MIKVSVIIPVYNTEEFLQRCVDSVLQQSMKDFELILVDDGSRDSSGQLCDLFAQRDGRVRSIHQSNQGAAAARNTGMAAARGQYITFIDSDDFVPANYLEQLLITAEDGCDLAVCPLQRPEDPGKLPEDDIRVDFRHPEHKEAFGKLFASYVLHGPCTKLYKRALLEKNNVRFQTDLVQGEDCVFVFTYLRFCHTLRYRTSPVYYYYNNVQSVTHRVRKGRFDNGVRVNSICLECVRQKDFMTDRIEQVWARATFKDAYHGIEDIYSDPAYASAGKRYKEVKRVLRHPFVVDAMKVARITGYNKTQVWLMKHRLAWLYCGFITLSDLKSKMKKG